MNVKVTTERRGHIPHTVREERIPMENLCSHGDGPRAKVAFTLSKVVGPDFIKVAVFVELECDQREKTVNEAARTAFYKAIEYQGDAFSILDAAGEIVR
ncbi:hypothetical protein LVJ94_34995 [Pendulispora rubella]|uniref:Uncharacterized protein n=1 Tax=Pendulispora rubella TaxID=2741070 RepID=A0ABZ2KTX1_9BACT